MTIEELKALDSQKAASFYEGCPDGQWDREASIWLRLAPEILALVEAASPNSFSSESKWHTALFAALDAFNAKLEAL